MQISRIEIGRLSLIEAALKEIKDLLDKNEITKAKAHGIIRRLNDLITNSYGEVVPVDKIEYDSILYNDQFKDIVDSINYNYIYYAAELDLLNITGKLVEAVIDGDIDKANNALSLAADSIDSLNLYISKYKKNRDSVLIDFNEASNNSAEIYNNYLIAKIKSFKESKISSIQTETNGLIGNMLELDKSTIKYLPLEDDQIKFVDEKDFFKNKARIKDASNDTIFEFEAYKLDDDVAADIIPIKIGSRVLDSNGGTTISYTEWNKAPEDDTLIGQILVTSNTSFNLITVSPNLINTYQKVRYIMVSEDGENWTTIAENVYLVPDINAFNNNFSSLAGNGIFFVPLSGIKAANIVFEQDTPYNTNIAHVFYHNRVDRFDSSATIDDGPTLGLDTTNGTVIAQDGPAWVTNNEKKEQYFSSDTIYIIDEDGNRKQLAKDAMAVAGKRWSISVKEISLSAMKYARESVMISKKINFDKKISKLSLSVNELVPSGCDVKYSISIDNGISWKDINPIERNGGKEIVSFVDKQVYETSRNIQYITVDSLPKSVILKVTITSDLNVTPVIKDIVLTPILTTED